MCLDDWQLDALVLLVKPDEDAPFDEILHHTLAGV
jgi:hypothetical protein